MGGGARSLRADGAARRHIVVQVERKLLGERSSRAPDRRKCS